VLHHLLFALKHEGVRLDLLAAALRKIDPQILTEHVRSGPNSVYARKLAYLWEALHAQQLPDLAEPGVSAAYVSFFDPGAYFVGKSKRNPRWRIDFNGLGDLPFCPVVRKTPEVQALVQSQVLEQAGAFAESVGERMLERAMAWAYLSETEGSFAIEREPASTNKKHRFAALLKRALTPEPLTEVLLVELQQAAITNPLETSTGFRNQQNRLQGDAPGAAGVTYVPPAPELARALMDALMRMANASQDHIDPLVRAGVLSFAFVFIHPFMDGNGRLSRYLVHHSLGQSGRLPANFLLPVSVAMKRHEDQYLAALKSFSVPARELCEVSWAGDDRYSFDWAKGADVWFRYMDLTEPVRFTLAMAKASLDEHMRQEVEFLVLFDKVKRYIDERYDLRGSDLASLIKSAHQNQGKLSKNRRKPFQHSVQEHVLDAIEQSVSSLMRGEEIQNEDDL
jgi:hypothetical protein